MNDTRSGLGLGKPASWVGKPGSGGKGNIVNRSQHIEICGLRGSEERASPKVWIRRGHESGKPEVGLRAQSPNPAKQVWVRYHSIKINPI